MKNYNETNTVTRSSDLTENDFTEREPTNEERWINDVNKEFDEDVPLVNETDPDPLDDDDFDDDTPLDDEDLAGEIPVEEPDEDFEDDDLFLEDDDELEGESDDEEFK